MNCTCAQSYLVSPTFLMSHLASAGTENSSWLRRDWHGLLYSSGGAHANGDRGHIGISLTRLQRTDEHDRRTGAVGRASRLLLAGLRVAHDVWHVESGHRGGGYRCQRWGDGDVHVGRDPDG